LRAESLAVAAKLAGTLDRSTPRAGVVAYLTMISNAYRLGESSLASPTMTPAEGVRVDSYLELNRQKGRRIDQVLASFVPGRIHTEATRAVVPAREAWRYRYVPIDGGAPSGQLTASYDTTYTLVKGADGAWRVDLVEATPLGEVR
jgi:hypothetical protein